MILHRVVGCACDRGLRGIVARRFEQAVDELAADDDLINQVLEITLDGDEELHILRYRLPPENG
jgi:hypothetical protein